MPSLVPAPRKLKRSTAHPTRLSAFAAWYTTFVCIVPPNCGLRVREDDRGAEAVRVPEADAAVVSDRAGSDRFVEQRLEPSRRPGELTMWHAAVLQ